MAKISSLSLFFPALNEATNVEPLLLSARQLLPEMADKWEIIPVNDGSSDGTGALFNRFAIEDPEHIHPVHHQTNRGYGSALISGFENSQYDFIFFTDGDLQFDLGELSLLIDRIDDGDLILGFRKNRRDPLLRKLYTFLWGTLVRRLFGFRVRDVNCAFKLIKREVMEKVKLSSTGAAVSTELLVTAHRAGFRFVEVGVTHYPRKAGKPTGANVKVIMQAFRELVALYKDLQ